MCINYSTLSSMIGTLRSINPDNLIDGTSPTVLNTNWELIMRSIDKLTLENLSNYKLFLEKLESALEKRGATDIDTDVINELTANIKALKEQVNKLIDEKAELTEDVTELTDVQEQLEELNKEVNTKLTEALSQIDTLTSEKEELTSTNETLNATITEQTETINTQKETITTQETTITEKENTITAQTKTIAKKEENITSLNTSIQDLMTAYNEAIQKSCVETAVEDVTDSTKDYKITDATITETTALTGNTVVLDNATSIAPVSVNANNATINGLTTTGTISQETSNAAAKIHSDGYVVIKDCTITPDSCYNGIEIGLGTGEAKNVLIENCTFTGFSHNMINIFAMAEGGIVTIKNCKFGAASGLGRVSNRTNTHFTINIEDCTCDGWDQDGEYAGAMIFQDYTSGSEETEEANKQAHKITINVTNLTGPNGLITPYDTPEEMFAPHGNRIIFVYNNCRGLIPYSEEEYPTLNIA